MTDSSESERLDSLPQINFSDIIKVSRRSSTEVERQVTICRYRTHIGFDFEQILNAVRRCEIRANDEFGVIGIQSSSDESNLEEQTSASEWIRTLYGIIGEQHFRWLEFESRNIYECMIPGTLKDTFLVEYYNENGELRYLTYGGARHSEKVASAHKKGFYFPLPAEQMAFTYDAIRQACSRFKELQKISYTPEGQADYGTVDEASMKTNYQNIIDPNAEKVKEVLENPKIHIREFKARFSMSHKFSTEVLSIRFTLMQDGRVTLNLPKIEFGQQLTDQDREERFYAIVKDAHTRIVTQSVSSKHWKIGTYQTVDQSVMDFIKLK